MGRTKIALVAAVLAAALPGAAATARSVTEASSERCVTPAGAAAPAPVLAEGEDQCWSAGRAADQAAHAGFQAYYAEAVGTSLDDHAHGLIEYGDRRSGYFHTPGALVGDPYRQSWERGSRIPLRFPNRYGAQLAATLWLGDDRSAGGRPLVVVTPGGGGFQQLYMWAAQGLAESGYAVVTFDPQGHGSSDVYPSEEFCGDGAGEWWRQPQEFGAVEKERCAGLVPAAPSYTPTLAAVHLFGIIDTLDWLSSDANPHRDILDLDRIALAGHSLGGWSSLVVGHADERVDAVVVWDSFGALPPGFVPRVPTMVQGSEVRSSCAPAPAGCRGLRAAYDAGLWGGAPGVELPGAHRDDHPAVRVADAVTAAAVPAMEVVLRGSTHFEWAYTYALAPTGFPASSKGERVAFHYTLAWLDRWLKPAGGGGVAAARDRLTLHEGRFDGSADASAIGTGRWDALAQANVPYTLAGEAVQDHLSRRYRSSYSFDGRSCDDARLGCTR